MIKQYRESREEFEKHYHKRSRVESVTSALKRYSATTQHQKEKKPEKRTPPKSH
jgi:hypothetical protein